MLGKLNSNLLISIGVALVLCAAVYYLNNSRMNRIETAINRQNQVLTAFIANVQNEIRGGGLRQQFQVQQSQVDNATLSPDVSSEEARGSVTKQMNTMEQQVPKIVVSDDESSEDEEEDSEVEVDSASESEENASESEESETEDDSDSESEEERKNIEFDNSDEVHHIKIVDIHSLSELPMFISEFKIETLGDLAEFHNSSSITELANSGSEVDDIAETDDASETETEGEDTLVEANINEIVSLDIIEEIKTIKLDADRVTAVASKAVASEAVVSEAVVSEAVVSEAVVASEAAVVSEAVVASEVVASEVVASEVVAIELSEEEIQLNYENLKVDELRKIAVDLNKATKDEVKKLKKPELLYLLREPKVPL